MDQKEKNEHPLIGRLGEFLADAEPSVLKQDGSCELRFDRGRKSLVLQANGRFSILHERDYGSPFISQEGSGPDGRRPIELHVQRFVETFIIGHHAENVETFHSKAANEPAKTARDAMERIMRERPETFAWGGRAEYEGLIKAAIAALVTARPETIGGSLSICFGIHGAATFSTYGLRSSDTKNDCFVEFVRTLTNSMKPQGGVEFNNVRYKSKTGNGLMAEFTQPSAHERIAAISTLGKFAVEHAKKKKTVAAARSLIAAVFEKEEK
jgi:hypothetical protein